MLATLLLIACTTQDNYLEKASTIACQKAEQCDQDAFDAAYDDVDQCVDATLVLLDAFASEACYEEHCTFSGANADKCLSAMRGLSCDEYQSEDASYDPACDEVWECEDEAELAACLLEELGDG